MWERCNLMIQLGLSKERKEDCLEVTEQPGIRQNSDTKNNHGISIGFIRLRGPGLLAQGRKSKIG